MLLFFLVVLGVWSVSQFFFSRIWVLKNSSPHSLSFLSSSLPSSIPLFLFPHFAPFHFYCLPSKDLIYEIMLVFSFGPHKLTVLLVLYFSIRTASLGPGKITDSVVQHYFFFFFLIKFNLSYNQKEIKAMKCPVICFLNSVTSNPLLRS